MRIQDVSGRQVVVIGAGPAGLAAAYELTRHDHRPLVLEQGATPGGLARTESYRGFRFDMGGHRFFTKAAPVMRLWREILGDDFVRRPRLSRIYYRGKFFAYPLKPLNALAGLGFWQAVLIVASYLRSYFDGAVIKRVSIAEHDRFAERKAKTEKPDNAQVPSEAKPAGPAGSVGDSGSNPRPAPKVRRSVDGSPTAEPAIPRRRGSR